MLRLSALLGSAVLLCTCLVGCSSNETTAPGDWTVAEDALQLQENLRVSEGTDFYFGRIADVAVSNEGKIYVGDNQAAHVKVLSPAGTLQDSVGTRGEGPGEFQHLLDLALARGDSLYVLDSQDGRVHVFTPGLAFERVFLVESDQGTPSNMMIPRGAESPSDQAFLFVYSPGAWPMAEEDAPMPVRSVSSGGTIGDTLFTTPPYRMASEDLGDGRKLFLTIPFTPVPFSAVGPEGRVHSAYGDSLTVTAYDRTGQPERTVRVPFESVPVTDEEIETALEDRTRGREQIRNEIPATKPAFEQFLVDDEGRYWFGRPTATPDSMAWWVAMPDDKRVVTETMPSEVRLLTVQNGQAYGRTTADDGAPTLVRYEVDLQP